MDNIRFAFLTSSDETIFLRFEITERPQGAHRPRFDEDDEDDDEEEQEEEAEEEQFQDEEKGSDMTSVETLKEARLYYSDPIKHSDILDEAKGTVPLRLALLYLLYTSSTSKWQLPADIGSAINYKAKTRAGEKW